MNNASDIVVNRPARPGFSWGGAVAALSLALIVFAVGSPAAAGMVDDVPFCLSVGKWGPFGPNGPHHDSIAYVDLATWKLVTDTAGVQPVTVLDPSPQPWIPVAGDWDGDGFDSILMFNTQDWSLVDIERGPVAPREGEDPSPNPWRPVAGDFDGDGRDSVLVYDLRDGATYRPEAGPLTVERYDPQPQPWIAVAGDWDGRGIDSIVTLRGDDGDPQPNPWIPVAGDFDGDGIDTVAMVHGPSGKLAEVELEQSLGKASRASRSRASSTAGKALQLANGCYITVKNLKTISVKLPNGTGGFTIKEHSTWEQWYCCPLLQAGPGGRYTCSVTLKSS